MPDVFASTFAELDPATLYTLLRLRVDVFVVEQDCPYPELDGRDAESGTIHLWTADQRGPTAYLRVLDDGSRWRIGRVCTRLDARGQALAGHLMVRAMGQCADRPIVLDAQSHLAFWYERFGFGADGADFVEDGIEHRPMIRHRLASAGESA
jgi:ElaA protein